MQQLTANTTRSRTTRTCQFVPKLLLLVFTAAFVLLHATQLRAVTVTYFAPSVYDSDTAVMDAALGISGYLIEDFEDTTLDVIPGLYFTDYTATFDVSQAVPSSHAWDGTAAASYESAGGDVTVDFYFDDADSVGFGISGYEFDSHGILVGTGDFEGDYEVFPFPVVPANSVLGDTRNAYYRIDREPGDGPIFGVGFVSPGHTESLNFDHLAVLPTPEPGTLSLLACGATGLLAWHRRRRRFGKAPRNLKGVRS